MWIFLDPFSAGLWITSACFFLFLGFVIWFIEHHTNKEFQGEKLQSNLSRFVVIVWVFVVLVLTSSYTATLSSVLTVQQIGMKEKSIGFLEEFAKALTSGSVDAYVAEILYVKSFLAMYSADDFSLIATASTTNGFGFVCPLAGEMSTQIGKMREEGTLKALEDKWLKRQSAIMSNPPSPKVLNLYSLRGLFLINGVSMTLALLVYVVHLVHEKLHVKVKMHIWSMKYMDMLVMRNQQFDLFIRLFPFLILMLLSFQTLLTAHEDPTYKDIQVGVILDMESGVGKVIYHCVTMAISDFYKANPDYKTRIVFITRDTKGEPLYALSAALNLLENTEVQAIIGPESTVEERFLEVLEDKANIPILSFSTTPFSNTNPNLLGITQDETTQFKGIAAMVESFKAKNMIVICEDTTNGREMATYMVSSFQEKNIYVTYTSFITASSNNEQMWEELRKLQTMQALVFVVHASPSLATNVFSMAKELGMMDEGYMWIVTSKTTNYLDSMDSEAIESMQGALGFRSYFPASRELREFISKWRKEHYALDPFMEFKEVDSNGIWAYDAVYALAMAVEREQTRGLASKELGTNIGTSLLLDEMLRVKFHGLGGEFKLMNGRIITKVMEVVNVIGKGDRRVGFWMMGTDGEFVKEIGKTKSSSSNYHGLESIMWPGGTTSINPKRRMLQTNGKKKLRILFPSTSRFQNIAQISVDPRTNQSAASGFCGDVFNAAFNALDYGVGIEVIPFSYKDMTYNDAIDKIFSKEYDAAIGDFTITANRSLYVDFTLPFTDLGTGTVARNAKNSMWIFLNPLSANLWITTSCFFLFLGFVIWFIEHRSNDEFQGSPRQQLFTTLWFAFSTLVYAHREKLQSNLSRFVVVVWIFVVLVLTSSYTATLSSVLTVQQIGMNDISTGFFQVLSPLGGVAFNKLKPVDPNLAKLYTTADYAKAINSGGVDALVAEILYIRSNLALYYASDFSLIATASTTNGFGFAFQKGSPLAREMSTEIAKMREDGTLKALEDKWLKLQYASMSKDFSSPSLKILNLYGLRGLFLISGVSMASALLLSMIHLAREKIKRRIWRYILRRSADEESPV
ncbi:unnamed protein product [Lactuca virosa]|uniref:Ionotropic glutamate receptor C-terminal domain-containing protein n=1 Tax=Lactuca virosa TaxID=75947 RepID=A0AAU9PA96_9ASTR|nr:unnamed protein product [Lactuca virosa]